MKLVVCAVILFSLVGCYRTPPQGTTTSGGGDAFAAEFKDIARTVVRRWKATPMPTADQHIGKLNFMEFEDAVQTVKVETTEEALSLDGYKVDALNYPEKNLIVLSLLRWATKMSFSEKRRLVIHEILGLLGKEPSFNYDLTFSILSHLDFYREVPILHFEVFSKAAQTLVEKTDWRPEEIISWVKDGHTRYTTYKLSAIKDSIDELTCQKTNYLDSPKNSSNPFFRCQIKCQYARMSDEPKVQVFVRTDGVLYKRYFKGEEGFDLRYIKGEFEGGPGPLGPVLSIYFDRES